MSVVLFNVVDLETAGMDPPASVIEIGVTPVYFDTETKDFDIGFGRSCLYRPAQEMAPDNIAVHHLTNQMLAHRPICTQHDIRSMVSEDKPQFLVAANCAFERKWITDELAGQSKWICTVKAAARLYPEAPSHGNQAMRYYLDLDLPEERAMPPHRACPDSYVTAKILEQMLGVALVRDLVQWTSEPRHLPRVPFGKHKGKKWPEIDAGYLTWMLKQGDLDPDAKHAAQLEINRRSGK